MRPSLDQGVLFVVSGPSGVGKSTLLEGCMAEFPEFAFSVSATTRGPREGEEEGVDYHFMGRERFDELLAADAFLEHATVYEHAYGTLKATTDAALATGRSLILDIDVQGSAQVRARMPDAVHIIVVPPNISVLEKRLRARGSDTPAVIDRRMAAVTQQLSACDEFDYVVVNNDLSAAQRTFNSIFGAELSRCSRRRSLVAAVRGWGMLRD